MKQFYELCVRNSIVSPLVTQLSWTNIVKKIKNNMQWEIPLQNRYLKIYQKSFLI